MIRKIAKRKRMQSKWARKLSLRMLTVGGFIAGAAMMQSCDKDILTGQPEWLGNSIYERLEEGIEVDGQTKTFKTTLRLIDDLKYKETLSKTGSKTLFVASDDAYQAWFNSNNIFGVRSYEDLSEGQKKQLFNGTMINNAYLIELMSNIPAKSDNTLPESGMCMRRETAASSLDNIPVLNVEDFPINKAIADDPVNRAWGSVRNQGKNIHIMKDETSAPMIHFLPQFMEKNNITDNDLYVISNHASESVQDSWVNGRKVISNEQTCKNGYIYVVDGVIESTPNMAEIINTNSNTTQWAKLLNRFSVPVAMDKASQEEFWRLHPEYANTDSLYTLSYLNYSGNHELYTPTGRRDDVLNASGLLKFDPGWNQYMADNTTIIMQNDAATMLVPNNKALAEWFDSGSGKVLKDKFGSWDNIPYETLVKLLNVNMQESFVASVPSKFPSILDDSQRSMGITIADIDSCIMGCNGVVYITNKVFAPSEYSSVMFPALIQSTSDYSVIYHALSSNYTPTYVTNNGAAKDFTPYLTAMDSKFSLIIPFNSESWLKFAAGDIKFLSFIDPCSYGLPQQYLLVFYYYKEQINCAAYPVIMAPDGSWELTSGTVYGLTADIAVNRLYDYLDNSILLEDITPDKTMYKTKAGSVIKAFKEGNDMYFQGGLQLHTGEKIKASSKYIYDMGSGGNGTTYGVNNEEDLEYGRVHIPMTSAKSVYEILKEDKDKGGDHLFYDLIYGDESGKGLFGTKDGKYYCLNPAENKNLTVFDNYNYTIYVPTDAAIKQMIDNGYLPTWDDYNNSESEDEKAVIADRIHSFVRYHIQDNSVYIGGDKVSNFQYESGKLNPKNNRFYSIYVTQDGNSLTVKDQLGRTYTANVAASNKCSREYWIEWGSGVKLDNLSLNSFKCNIAASSNAVLHKINGVLLYDKDQETKWK
jgi:hypothetical protein